MNDKTIQAKNNGKVAFGRSKMKDKSFIILLITIKKNGTDKKMTELR